MKPLTTFFGQQSTKVCIILSKPELRERRRERGNARGGATKKRVFHALPHSEIYTSASCWYSSLFLGRNWEDGIDVSYPSSTFATNGCNRCTTTRPLLLPFPFYSIMSEHDGAPPSAPSRINKRGANQPRMCAPRLTTA